MKIKNLNKFKSGAQVSILYYGCLKVREKIPYIKRKKKSFALRC